MKKSILLFFAANMLLLFSSGNILAFKLFDDKLDIKGSIQQTLNIMTHEEVRDMRIGSFRTIARLETLYDAVKTPDLKVRLYAMGNYYYDEGLNISSDLRKSIRYEAGKNKFRHFRRPRNSEEWLKELYVDIQFKNFQVRIGKQLISWGESAEAQVTDVINPLDVKYLVAFPDWEDFKLGLWMVRMFYKPENMWQDLLFELIVIPFDFEERRLPPAGSSFFLGPPPMPYYGMQKMFDKMRSDAPKDGSNCFEIGLRIKGYADIGEGIDWTISHFYTRLDTPLVDGQKGFNNLVLIMLNMPARGKVYTYPNYNSTGFTFATTWNRIGSAIRGELAYNTNRDYQYGPAFSGSDIKEKDMVTFALKIARPTMVPWLSRWNRDTSVEITFTWYQYWLLNHEYNKRTGDYIQWESNTRDSTWTKLTLSLFTSFMHQTLMPLCNFAYDLNGSTTIVSGLIYQPGDHWQWMVSYMQINEKGLGRYQNQVICSMRYEFW